MGRRRKNRRGNASRGNTPRNTQKNTVKAASTTGTARETTRGAERSDDRTTKIAVERSTSNMAANFDPDWRSNLTNEQAEIFQALAWYETTLPGTPANALAESRLFDLEDAYEKKHGQQTCCICGKPLTHPLWGNAYFGNNPYPIAEGRCCDECNKTLVQPARSLTYDNWGKRPEIVPATVEDLGIKNIKSSVGKCQAKWDHAGNNRGEFRYDPANNSVAFFNAEEIEAATIEDWDRFLREYLVQTKQNPFNAAPSIKVLAKARASYKSSVPVLDCEKRIWRKAPTMNDVKDALGQSDFIRQKLDALDAAAWYKNEIEICDQYGKAPLVAIPTRAA